MLFSVQTFLAVFPISYQAILSSNIPSRISDKLSAILSSNIPSRIPD